MRKMILLLGMLTFILFTFNGSAEAIVYRHDVAEADYVAALFPAVGQVAGGGTGTLVASNKVLTAT